MYRKTDPAEVYCMLPGERRFFPLHNNDYNSVNIVVRRFTTSAALSNDALEHVKLL